ncbi:MAG: hypothetical protein M3069_24685 [Chloroflexota bacterium]|nr:hypothetical protein [Chloroflexota bacterium]
MHQDPVGSHVLASDQIERFVPVTDADYDPIRRMASMAERLAPWPTWALAPIGV